MTVPLTGGCMCGAIRYEGSTEPVLQANCHCRDCQKASSGPYVPALAVPKDSLTITGEPKYYEVKADSGNANSRGFCPNCGSPLFTRLEAMPDVVLLKAGTLDDPSLYTPSMNIFTASAQPWDHIPDDIPGFAGMPEG